MSSLIPTYVYLCLFRMSSTEFNPCCAGRVLMNAGATSLQQLQLALDASEDVPLYVQLKDYVDVMESFIHASALKKVAAEEADHYRELLSLHSQFSADVGARDRIHELEQAMVSVLASARAIRDGLCQMEETADVRVCKEAYGRLMQSVSDLCLVQDVTSQMHGLSTRADE